MPIKSFKDLIVWQKSMDLVEDLYRLTAELPKNEEYGLKSQVRRAAVSVPSNIAEGQSRNHRKEFLQFIYIALGSLSELQTQLEIANRLNLIPRQEAHRILPKCEEIAKMLHGLINSITTH